MKKGIRCIAIALIALMTASTAAADIGSFKKSIEDSDSKPGKSERDDAGGSGGNPDLAIFLIKLATYVWAGNNLGVTYGDYPHADGKFIRYSKIEFDPYTGDAVWTPSPGKSWWYSAELQPTHMVGIGAGALASFRGNTWKFFGPYFDGHFLADGKTVTGGVRLGGSLSIVQTNPFSLAAYGQWAGWFGEIERRGGAAGITIDSYPFKPIALHLRAGSLWVGDATIGEFEFRAGFLAGPWEFSAGTRSWSLGQSKDAPCYPGYFISAARYF